MDVTGLVNENEILGNVEISSEEGRIGSLRSTVQGSGGRNETERIALEDVVLGVVSFRVVRELVIEVADVRGAEIRPHPLPRFGVLGVFEFRHLFSVGFERVFSGRKGESSRFGRDSQGAWKGRFPRKFPPSRQACGRVEIDSEEFRREPFAYDSGNDGHALEMPRQYGACAVGSEFSVLGRYEHVVEHGIGIHRFRHRFAYGCGDRLKVEWNFPFRRLTDSKGIGEVVE